MTPPSAVASSLGPSGPPGPDQYPTPPSATPLTPSIGTALGQLSLQPTSGPVAAPKATMTHSGQRDHSRPRVPTSVEAPRKSIKDASKAVTKTPPGSGLGDKLQAKRQLLLAAKVPADAPPGLELAAHPAGDGRRPVHIQDDDFSSEEDVDLLEAETIAAEEETVDLLPQA